MNDNHRVSFRIERAIKRIFAIEKSNNKLSAADSFDNLKMEYTVFYEENSEKYPDLDINIIKQSNIVRGATRPLVTSALKFLADFLDKKYKYIFSGLEVFHLPYTDSEMEGIKEGIFSALRHSTTQKTAIKNYKGVISNSRVEIWKEPAEGIPDYYFWFYKLVKLHKEKDDAILSDPLNSMSKSNPQTLSSEGIIMRNYGHYLFVGSEHYAGESEFGRDNGIQIMYVEDDNDSNNLRGLVLSATHYKKQPCATRVYLSEKSDMSLDDTFVDYNTTEIDELVGNKIDEDWHLLLP